MDGDGDLDVLVSDRLRDSPNETLCARHSGLGWLENPNDGSTSGCWQNHMITTTSMNLGFAALGDLDGDGDLDAAAAGNTPKGIVLAYRLDASGLSWLVVSIPYVGAEPKGVAIGDIDRDGLTDIALSLTSAKGKEGVVWYSPVDGLWHTLSGVTNGDKFDLLSLLDMDGDGDLDALSSEENAGLGVIWYSNPTIP